MKFADFRSWQILLQKSFRGGERKFLEPLEARFDAWRREGPYRFIQNRSRTSVVALKRDTEAAKSEDQLREIFRVVRFSTFATISALFGHGERA